MAQIYPCELCNNPGSVRLSNGLMRCEKHMANLYAPHRITAEFVAHLVGDGDSEETIIPIGELVYPLKVHTYHNETTVEFARSDGLAWVALFDMGNPFISPFAAVE